MVAGAREGVNTGRDQAVSATGDAAHCDTGWTPFEASALTTQLSIVEHCF